MKYFRRVEGPTVYLSPINPEDYELYTKWLNDPEILVPLGNGDCNSLPGEKAVLEKMANEQGNFAIVRGSDDALLGNCSFFDLDQRHRRAKCGLFIGDREQLGKGYGSEALALLVAFGFDEWNLHNIMLDVYAFNERALRAYEKVGFKRIGLRRQAHFARGAFHDEIMMDILPGELNRDLIRR